MAGGAFSSLVISANPEEYAKTLFAVALTLSAASLVAVAFVGEEPDSANSAGVRHRSILPRRSTRSAARIALAGALGSVGLGMVTPLMPLYFRALGASDLKISLVCDASYILSAAVTLASSRIERALGSIRGIFVLRVAGTLPLAAIPFTHIFTLASAIYVARTALYQAALPIRQSVSMGLYADEERSRASSITGKARRLPYGASTLLGSLVFSAGEFVGLFAAAAGISFLDPLLYYIFFKNIRQEDLG